MRGEKALSLHCQDLPPSDFCREQAFLVSRFAVRAQRDAGAGRTPFRLQLPVFKNQFRFRPRMFKKLTDQTVIANTGRLATVAGRPSDRSQDSLGAFPQPTLKAGRWQDRLSPSMPIQCQRFICPQLHSVPCRVES
jgi:hypothetical protein